MNTPRSVLVVGGVTGIGRAISEKFAASGAKVRATARNQDEIQAAPKLAGNITADSLDIADEQAITAFFAAHISTRLDILVNAAGIILRDGQEFDATNFAQV